MSEMNIDELPGLRRWMKKRSHYYFRNGVLTLAILTMLGFLFWVAEIDDTNIKEVLFLACFFLFVSLYSCYQFVLWVRSFKWNIGNYWFGRIIALHCIYSAKKKIRGYRIIADVNGKTMEGACLVDTYNRAKIGDKILLFTLKGDKVFCVHPDE